MVIQNPKTPPPPPKKNTTTKQQTTATKNNNNKKQQPKQRTFPEVVYVYIDLIPIWFMIEKQISYTYHSRHSVINLMSV